MFEPENDPLCRLSPNFQFVAVSGSFNSALGWSQSALEGQTLFDIIHPQDQEDLRAALARICPSVGPSRTGDNDGRSDQARASVPFVHQVPATTFTCRTKNSKGHYRWFEWIVAHSAEDEGFHARIRNVDEDAQRMCDLRVLFETSAEMFVIFDMRARKLRWLNQACKQVLGWDADSLRTWDDFTKLVHPDDHDHSRAAAYRITRGEFSEVPSQSHFEARYRRKDGEWTWLAWTGEFLPERELLFAVGRDISNIKQFEAELRSAKETAERAREVAENANRARSEFLTNMSHELRTPLNAILGYAQLLELDELDERQSDSLDAIRRSGEHLLALLNDMLDLAKFEAGKLSLSPSEVHLGEFLAGIARVFEVRARSKGLSFDYAPAADVPVIVRFDQIRMRQVLVNLLSNAVKFTEHGGVSFSVAKVDGALRFSVADTGIGIAPERLQSLFEPFGPLPAVGTRTADIEGLGLAVSSRLTRVMGGELQVESIYGRGTVFWFEITPEIVTTWQRPMDKPRAIVGYEGPVRSILIADDKFENREILSRMLTPVGFVVLHANDGDDAVKQTKDHQPDLIFMDLVMPCVDGFEAMRRIRAYPTIADTAIIAVSASSLTYNSERQPAVSFDAFLGKPVRREQVFSLLQEHLELTWRHEDDNDIAIIPQQQGASAQKDNAAITPAVIILPKSTTSTAVLTENHLRTIDQAASIGDIRTILTVISEARTSETGISEHLSSIQSEPSAMPMPNPATKLASSAQLAPPGLAEEIYRLAKRFQSRKIRERIAPLLDRIS